MGSADAAQSESTSWYVLSKRALDVLGGAGGLLAVGLIYLPVAIAIKLDSPGPVIFVQDRLGKDLEVFRIHKFRSMLLDAPDSGLKPDAADDRVTRVGRFLRRTSIDELPQFWDVLRGAMSLVGPRPEQLAFLEQYDVAQQRRFGVKPGLTGWWQVNGRPQPMYEHADYDLYYVEHRSLRLDLEILLRTIPAMIQGKGAC